MGIIMMHPPRPMVFVFAVCAMVHNNFRDTVVEMPFMDDLCVCVFFSCIEKYYAAAYNSQTKYDVPFLFIVAYPIPFAPVAHWLVLFGCAHTIALCAACFSPLFVNYYLIKL